MSAIPGQVFKATAVLAQKMAASRARTRGYNQGFEQASEIFMKQGYATGVAAGTVIAAEVADSRVQLQQIRSEKTSRVGKVVNFGDQFGGRFNLLSRGWNAMRGLASGAATLTAKDVGQKAALTTVTAGVGFGVNKVLNRASARFETGETVKAATVQSIAQPTVSSIVSSGGGGYGGGYLQPAQEEENSLAWLALLGVLARAFFF